MAEHAEITHKEAIAALPAATLAELKVLTDGLALRHLVLHAGAIAAIGALIMATTSAWLLVPLLILHGVLLSFLFTAQHECIHGTAFRTPWVNVLVAEGIGFVTLLPPRWFRYFHLAHHRHTQDAEHDPELASPKPQTWLAYLWALTGYTRWHSMIATMLRLAAGGRPAAYVPPKAHGKVIAEARAYLAAYVLLIGIAIGLGWSWLIPLWLVPTLLGQPFLRAYLMAEHTACPLVPDMLLNTRTTFASPLVNWLAWNMPHHTAHHAVPTVPFHQLPRLTAALRPMLRSTADGYAAAHRQIVCAWPRAANAAAASELASKQP
jgi:fatty acid desaturase